jgi:hypothetical protein
VSRTPPGVVEDQNESQSGNGVWGNSNFIGVKGTGDARGVTDTSDPADGSMGVGVDGSYRSSGTRVVGDS